MFKTTPENLHDEITYAMEFRRRHLDATEQLILQMVGDSYATDLCPGDGIIHENIVAEYVWNLGPSLAFNAPRFTMPQHYPSYHDEQLEEERAALNQVSIDNRLGVTLRRLAVDFALGWGCAAVEAAEQVGLDGNTLPNFWPKVRRIPPAKMLIDPAATHEDEARWIGHEWDEDLDTLEAAIDPDTNEPVFDVAVLRAAPIDAVDDESISDDTKQETPARNRVRLVDIFVRETGMIYTMALHVAGAYARAPRKAFSSPRGPYVVFGFGIVPDRVFPLSAMVAAKGGADDLNTHAQQIHDDAGTAKRMLVYDKGEQGLGEKLTTTPNGHTLGVNGKPRDVIDTIEWGGPQKANLDYSAILAMRIDRLLGISQTRRGEVNPDATATAESIADAGTSRREQFTKAIFQEQVGQIASRILWCLRSSRLMRRDITMDDPETGNRVGALYVGGERPGGLNADEETECSIEPYSMELTTESMMQRRAIQNTELMSRLGPFARNYPEWNVEAILKDHMAAFNMPGNAQRYLNVQLLRMFQGAGAAQVGIPPEMVMMGAGNRPPVGSPSSIAPEGEAVPAQQGGFLARNARPV